MRVGECRSIPLPVARGFSPARRETGLTLVQLLVALAALLTLALVLPASLAVRVNHARIARAERDVRAIADAIQRFERDNGFLPLSTRAIDGGPGSASDRVDLLTGPGEMPRVGEVAGVGWLSSRSDSLSGSLGPYLSAPPKADPWGNRYLVSTSWVISAGPNGVLETPCQSTGREAGLIGDDVGVRARHR